MEVTTARGNETYVLEGLLDFPEDTPISNNASNETLITSGPIFEVYANAALGIYIYPLSILLGFIFIGVIGNMFVLYIFTFRWQRSKTSVFIITLAALDITNCSINMPIEVYILAKPLSFDYDAFCKVARCFSYIITAAYSFVLVAVAFDRYLMICRPLKRMTLGKRYAYRTCIGAIAIAVITQWPSFFLYGTFTFKLPVKFPPGNQTLTNNTIEQNDVFVYGKTCLVTNYYYYENRLPTFLFQGFLFFGHVIIFITLAVVYILIGRRLFMSSHVDIEDNGAKQGLLTKSIMSALTGNSISSNRNSRIMGMDNRCNSISKRLSNVRSGTEILRNSDSLNITNGHGKLTSESHKLAKSLTSLPKAGNVNERHRDLSLIQDTIKEKQPYTVHPSRCVSDPNDSTKDMYDDRKTSLDFTESSRYSSPHGIKRSVSLDIGRLYSVGNGRTIKPSNDLKELSLKRNTLIMRMVTFTFILSYLPFLVLVTLRYSDDDVPNKLSVNAKIVYHVFLRSYFLNSVIRPFIYIVMNEQYRKKMLELVKPRYCCIGKRC